MPTGGARLPWAWHPSGPGGAFLTEPLAEGRPLLPGRPSADGRACTLNPRWRCAWGRPPVGDGCAPSTARQPKLPRWRVPGHKGDQELLRTAPRPRRAPSGSSPRSGSRGSLGLRGRGAAGHGAGLEVESTSPERRSLRSPQPGRPATGEPRPHGAHRLVVWSARSSRHRSHRGWPRVRLRPRFLRRARWPAPPWGQVHDVRVTHSVWNQRVSVGGAWTRIPTAAEGHAARARVRVESTGNTAPRSQGHFSLP